MMNHEYVNRIVDLTDPGKNIIYNMSREEAIELVRSGDTQDVRKIDGQFALIAVEGKTIRMARSIGRPLRFFIAKLKDGPCLVLAERIDTIYNYLKQEGLDDQFHPSYTRMAPAHYITTVELLGCPDPGPVYKRFFTPERNRLKNNDVEQLGKLYIGTLYEEIKKWLKFKATKGPIGVTFSAGVDSGSVFLLTYHALLELGESPSRLKAFTLSVDGEGEDLKQAREFLKALNLELFLEPIEIESSELNWKKTVKVIEDYKPLDIQAATMNLAVLEGVRSRYPEVPGWRKIRNWHNEMKNMMRVVGKTSSSGGKGKDQRVKHAVRRYLSKARTLQNKLERSKETFPVRDITDILISLELDRFMGFLDKHINLLERRILKGEHIPHNEKLFSIFEEYTEWITKGKLHPNVELGKKLTITTDQYNLIVDYRVMDHQSDSEIVKPLVERITSLFPVKSWSFDKGFWHKDNKKLLEEYVEKVIMPKKGKCNKMEQAEESQRQFKLLRNKHSAVESNINELECRGLDRCPDRGYPNFKRYIGLAVGAYNLRRIGQKMIVDKRQSVQSTDRERKAAA